MSATDIHFLIFYPDHRPIENNTLFTIRHEIAKMFKESGFGEIGLAISQNGEERFINTHAVPTEDRCIDNELSVFFTFNVHENRLHNRVLRLRFIDNFQNLIREQYHMIAIIEERFIS